MNRRNLFKMSSLPVASIVTAYLQVSYAEAASYSYTVPENTDKINVKSFTKDGTQVLNYNFNVEPGQKFVLKTI